MLFNSFEYLLLLWTCFVLAWTLRERRPLRHTLLALASIWFYSLANWRYTFLLLGSSLLDYYVGPAIERARQRADPRAMKRWLWVSLAGNLGSLGFFKYYDFFVTSTETSLARLGVDAHFWHLDLLVPVGISFYTFQTLSYTIDIYRGTLKPIHSLRDFLMYVSFFPQLVAGPIVRAADFLPQLERDPQFQRERISSGLFQILRGMFKKLILADILGTHVVDVVYRDADSLSQAGAAAVLIATYAYALQMYTDFAGYSDIAIGSARLLGYELCINFNAPFQAKSLEEFWSRWHISMSSWFRDYVFIPLGGSRGSVWFTCRNLVLTTLLSGLWHGAAWNFVLWGLWFGFWMTLIRLTRKFVLPGGKFPSHWFFHVAGVVFTGHLVWYSGLLFRCHSWPMVQAATLEFFDWSVPFASSLPGMGWQLWGLLALGYASHHIPVRYDERLEQGFCRIPTPLQGLLVAAAIVLFFGLHPPGLAPFIYFQF